MQVSSAFVVIMGMGVTFVGLTCIIFQTMLEWDKYSSTNARRPTERPPQQLAAGRQPPRPVPARTGLRPTEVRRSAYLVGPAIPTQTRPRSYQT